MIQWLRLYTLNARGLGSIPGKETRSHMLQLRSGTAKLKKIHTHTHIVLGIIFSIMKFHGHMVSSLIWCQSGCPTHLLPHSVEPAPCHSVDVLSVPSSFQRTMYIYSMLPLNQIIPLSSFDTTLVTGPASDTDLKHMDTLLLDLLESLLEEHVKMKSGFMFYKNTH